MTALPFADFLEVLRHRGFGVGLQDHVAVGKLLDRWEHTDRAALRDAIAALVARHDAEVREIRVLFDEVYPARARAAVAGPEIAATRLPWNVRLQARLQSRRAWGLALALLATLVTLAVAARMRGAVLLPPLPAAPALYSPTVAPSPASVSPSLDVRVPVTIAGASSALPAPPRRVWWTAVGWVAAGTAIVTIAALWGVRLRSAARDWSRRAWRRVLADLPGPYEIQWRIRDLGTRLPKADVEEAATIIGRAFSRDALGRHLDVRATVRAAARAARPQLVFAARRVQEPILVLQDVSQAMDPHAERVDGLLDDLRRQGVALDRWYYDGDVSRPAPRPVAAPLPLEQLLRRRDSGPVMVISAAEGLRATVATSDGAWLEALMQPDRRVWLTPVTDPRLWPTALRRMPLPVVPMTRRGLIEAASLLAHAERIGTAVTSRFVEVERRASAGDVRRLQRLASLVPFPTVSMLEQLRRRFAPDIPESAVIYAAGGTTAGGDLPLRMPDDEVRELSAEMRRTNPALEARAREYLLRVLAESEPPPGSAAHVRWQASAAIQRLQLAHLQSGDVSVAAGEVRRLESGPLWEEVRAAAARQPATIVGRARSDPAAEPPPFAAAPAETPPFAWRWPRLADVAAAMVLALVAGALVAFTPAARRPAPHQDGAYELVYRASASGDSQGALDVRVAAEHRDVPLTVQLHRDGQAIDGPVAIDPELGATVPLDPDEGAHVYQVRAGLPNGALAASNAVWAPSALVVINAQPWARVRITSSDGRVSAAETTPVAVSLPPGTYTMAFENGGLTAASSQQVRVTAPGPQFVSAPIDPTMLDGIVTRLGGRAAGGDKAPTSRRN
jgi:hypothetical protein